jgi:hypothetical protein
MVNEVLNSKEAPTVVAEPSSNVKRPRKKRKPRKDFVIKSFAFKNKSYEQLRNELNKKLPIKLKKYNNDLIKRVCERCTFLSPVDIKRIILGAFQSIRDLMVLRRIINFRTFLYDMKFNFFLHREKFKTYPCVRMSLKTPNLIRWGKFNNE